MSTDQAIHILLLDGRIISLPWTNYHVSDLISVIAAFLNLCESEYFGIAYKDYRGKEHWLQNSRNLSDHEIRRTGEIIQLVFRIRFYSENSRVLFYPALYEQFFLQAKRFLHNGNLVCHPNLHFHLIGLELYTKHGPYRDYESAKDNLLRCHAFPKHFSQKQISMDTCVEQSLKEYREIGSRMRNEGIAMIEFVETIETFPSYGVHFMEVSDKSGIPWWLGISFKGIEQYDIQDKTEARKIFPWANVQNLYCRDKKFSIEFQEHKRTSSSHHICSGEEITVQVWYATSPQQANNLFSEISAHYAHYKRNSNNSYSLKNQNKEIFCKELTEWIRRGGSLNCQPRHDLLQLPNQTDLLYSINIVYESSGDEAMERQFGEFDSSIESPIDRKQRLKELNDQKEGLSKLLEQKIELFRELCQEEFELTGKLPDDYIEKPGEVVIRHKRKIPTAFVLSPQIMNRPMSEQSPIPCPNNLQSKEELEVSYELQKQIVQAKHKLLVEQTAPSKIRKQRKEDYNQSLDKLKSIERELDKMRLRDGSGPNFRLTNRFDERPRTAHDKVDLRLPDNVSYHSSGPVRRARQQLNSDSELRPPQSVRSLSKINSNSCHSLNHLASNKRAAQPSHRSAHIPQSPQSAQFYTHRSAGNQSDSTSHQIRSPLSYQYQQRARPPAFLPSSSVSSHSEYLGTTPPIPVRSRGHRGPPVVSEVRKPPQPNVLPYASSSSTSSSSREPNSYHGPKFTINQGSYESNPNAHFSTNPPPQKSPTRVTYLDSEAFRAPTLSPNRLMDSKCHRSEWNGRLVNSQSSLLSTPLESTPEHSTSAVEVVAAACSATAKRSASESSLTASTQFRYEPRSQLEEAAHFNATQSTHPHQSTSLNDTAIYVKRNTAHKSAVYPSHIPRYAANTSTESPNGYSLASNNLSSWSSQPVQMASSHSSRSNSRLDNSRHWCEMTPPQSTLQLHPRMVMSCGDASITNSTADSNNSFEKPYETSDYYKYSESLRRERNRARQQEEYREKPFVVNSGSVPYMAYGSFPNDKIPSDVNYSDSRMSQSYTSAFTSDPYSSYSRPAETNT